MRDAVVPFEQCGARSFSRVSLQKNAPARSGVYGLSDSKSWLFVGEADNIQAALSAHLDEGGGRWGGRTPVGFAYEICSGAERTRRFSQLVWEFRPLFQANARKPELQR